MMKNTRPIFLAAMLALLPTGAMAQADVQIAQDACQVAGQRVAAERGATLLAAEAVQRNGQALCEIVILTPATDGERAKREVVVVAR